MRGRPRLLEGTLEGLESRPHSYNGTDPRVSNPVAKPPVDKRYEESFFKPDLSYEDVMKAVEQCQRELEKRSLKITLGSSISARYNRITSYVIKVSFAERNVGSAPTQRLLKERHASDTLDQGIHHTDLLWALKTRHEGIYLYLFSLSSH